MTKYIKHWVEFVEDGPEGADLVEVERSADVTAEIHRMEQERDRYKSEAAAAKQALVDIKNRRSWDDIEIVQDRASGLAAVVRTTYRWEMVGMRLDFDPQMYYGGIPQQGVYK